MKRILLSICFLAIGLWASAGDMSNSIELTQLYIIGDAPPILLGFGQDSRHAKDRRRCISMER